MNKNISKDLLVHSLNVSKYALLLGKELNLSINELNILQIGGLLHDIGKIYIPSSILNKSTSLTNDEFELIKRHTTIGNNLMPKEYYSEIKKIIRNHHERIDGNGYPDGLKGNEISYFAKIISIVDAFDAMTSKRSYNKVKTFEEALEELYNCSRQQMNKNNEIIQQFDTFLVDKFIETIKRTRVKPKELFLH